MISGVNLVPGIYNYYPGHVVHVPVLALHPQQPQQPQLGPMSTLHRHRLEPPQIPLAVHTYYDFLVVVDFEATCEETPRDSKPRPIRTERPEIIQFPAVLIDVRRQRIVDTFDMYVKPVENPILSAFCTKLTGISQTMVDHSPEFPKVLKRFERWLKKYGLSNEPGQGRTFMIVTDGSYDMGHFLFKQCEISSISYPPYARRWMNIRTIFGKMYKIRWFSLKSVLDIMGERFEGRQHNGLDDAKNISKILIMILREGGIAVQTEKVVLDSWDQVKNEFRILTDKRASKYDLATVKPVYGSEKRYIIMETGKVLSIPPETDTIDLQRIESEETANKENVPCPSKPETKSVSDKKGKNKRKLPRGDAALPSGI